MRGPLGVIDRWRKVRGSGTWRPRSMIMHFPITLNEKERQLRRLLLDVAAYVDRSNAQNAPMLRFAGGWVRDKLLGQSSGDIDIAIDTLTGLQFARHMKAYLETTDADKVYAGIHIGSFAEIAANPEKSKHLETVSTKILGFDIDLVNLRKETYTQDSRNPLVTFGTAEEDALRRDSTINSLFYNLTTESIEDFSGRGMNDLQRGLIKTPLDPLQTFCDDPLRILRAVRFASRYGFAIDDGDKLAMKNAAIGKLLRTKISRERIGTEISKMLRGPDPLQALNLINELDLYHLIFTDNFDSDTVMTGAISWSKAIDVLQRIDNSDDPASLSQHESNLHPLRTIKRILLRDANEQFLAWMLSCFVPWAQASYDQNWRCGKTPTSRAANAARHGLKADNRICRVIDSAATNFENVIEIRNASAGQSYADQAAFPPMHQARKREVQGIAIRGWGPDWRSTVVFAVLVEAATSENSAQVAEGLAHFASWLEDLERSNLLNADKIKPLINGKQLLDALDVKEAGPWVKKGLDIIIAWQFRNPQASDPREAIQAIRDRSLEIGIPV